MSVERQETGAALTPPVSSMCRLLAPTRNPVAASSLMSGPRFRAASPGSWRRPGGWQGLIGVPARLAGGQVVPGTGALIQDRALNATGAVTAKAPFGLTSPCQAKDFGI